MYIRKKRQKEVRGNKYGKPDETPLSVPALTVRKGQNSRNLTVHRGIAQGGGGC